MNGAVLTNLTQNNHHQKLPTTELAVARLRRHWSHRSYHQNMLMTKWTVKEEQGTVHFDFAHTGHYGEL